jgi:hypothetical protein
MSAEGDRLTVYKYTVQTLHDVRKRLPEAAGFFGRFMQDPYPTIFVSNIFKTSTNILFSNSFAYYFLKVHLHHFSKI